MANDARGVPALREKWTVADANRILVNMGRPDLVDNESNPKKVLAVTGTAVIDAEDTAAFLRGFGIR